jgi:hypothetical protein
MGSIGNPHLNHLPRAREQFWGASDDNLEHNSDLLHTPRMRIDESSPRIYLIIMLLAVLLIGASLGMYWSELAGLVRALASP